MYKRQTLSPVHDSEQEYRYSIGVLSDAAQAPREGGALEKLKAAMPKSFQAVLQPRAFSKALTKVDQEAQRKQWKSSLAKFTRLLWSMDWEGSLRSLVSQPASIGVFGQWLSKESPNDAKQLELIALLAQLSQAPPEQQTEMAMQLCQRYMGQMLSLIHI